MQSMKFDAYYINLNFKVRPALPVLCKVSITFSMKHFYAKTFSPIDMMLKQLSEMKLFQGTFQSENLDYPNSVIYLKMKMNGCYGRVKAGQLCQMHIRVNDSLFL